MGEVLVDAGGVQRRGVSSTPRAGIDKNLAKAARRAAMLGMGVNPPAMQHITPTHLEASATGTRTVRRVNVSGKRRYVHGGQNAEDGAA
jgi:hypothetical protein